MKGQSLKLKVDEEAGVLTLSNEVASVQFCENGIRIVPKLNHVLSISSDGYIKFEKV